MHWGAFASYLLATQGSICLFHGYQHCLSTSVLRLATISCFTKGVPCVVVAGDCTTHFWPREPGTALTFICIKSECPSQGRVGEGVHGSLFHKRDQEIFRTFLSSINVEHCPKYIKKKPSLITVDVFVRSYKPSSHLPWRKVWIVYEGSLRTDLSPGRENTIFQIYILMIWFLMFLINFSRYFCEENTAKIDADL